MAEKELTARLQERDKSSPPSVPSRSPTATRVSPEKPLEGATGASLVVVPTYQNLLLQPPTHLSASSGMVNVRSLGAGVPELVDGLVLGTSDKIPKNT